MRFLPYAVVIWLFLVGLYGVVTSRHSVYLVNCLSVTQSSTYLLLLTIGYRAGGTAPILDGLPPGAATVDPLVQAMTLTDIVVGAVVSALILVFAVQAHKKTGGTAPDQAPSERG